MTTMHLLVIKDTGHVLAALTQTVSAGEPDVETLTGTSFPVQRPRSTGSAFAPEVTRVPAEMLERKSVAFDAAVAANPQAYVVDGGRPTRLPDTAPNPPVVDRSATRIAGGLQDVPVVVALAAQGQPEVDWRSKSGAFDLNGAVVLEHSVPPGAPPAELPTGRDYLVMVAHGGRRLEWTMVSL